MATSILCIDCSGPETFSQELTRLTDLGFQAAPHTDIMRLESRQFLIHLPLPPNPTGAVNIIYRE